jgi:uncharacterized membrane protein (DUF106 family)
MAEKGGSTEHQGPGFLDSLKARAEAQDEDDDEDGGFSLWMILLFGGVFLVMFNPDLRFAVGDYVGMVLEPLIGFQQAQPALTIFFASLITGAASGAVRHVMMDHLEMARVQKEMKAFQNELKEARDNDNNYKVKRLTELQPEIMKKQAGMSGKQFKPMGFTLIVVIPMFGWLWTFMQGLPDPSLAAPWGRTMLLESAPIVSFLPTWILMYSLFSIPIGQLVQKGLKAVEFSSELGSPTEAP